MKCMVFVTEKLLRTIEVEAEDEAEALEKAKKAYRDEEIVLDYNDYVETKFDVAAMPKED